MTQLFEEPAPAVRGCGLFAHVALERSLEKAGGLTYGVPADLRDLRVGDRVLVPLGRHDRPVAGYVLSITDTCDLNASRIKMIAARDKRSVNLPDDLIELAQWIGRYYCCPLGMVLATMLPAAVKRGTGLVRRFYVDLHDPVAAASFTSIVEHHKLRGKQADVLEKVMELSLAGRLPVEAKSLADQAGAKSITSVKQLVDKGILKQVIKTEVRAIWAEHAVEGPRGLSLNADQQAALDSIISSLGGGFCTHLLLGVTGSGKTEVYIRALEPVVGAGRRAIVLVPEIALTPQTVGRFLGRFARVAVLHSGLTQAQRHEQWALIREGWAQVVVGARSAVFAPVADLGLIIVDEEHDASYKQDQAPRYHARDVAVKRAQMTGATVVLGSATPSLESYHNAVDRRVYRMLRLPRRATSQPLPRVDIVDMTHERRKRYEYTGSAGIHLLSIKLEKALRQTFDAGGQAMLLLNRRGFANYIACPDHRCGWIKTCDHCDVAMVYHKEARLPQGGLVRCHYCSFENLLPRHCPVCAKKVTPFGLGTQRVEEEIARKFPGVPAARMDSDAMRTAKDYVQTLDAFRRGDTKLLVGTQMIAKGLDFPGVRLVGVISADTALVLPDFRAAERTFQLVCQVAGRTGRSDQPGWVIVQTFTPGHPAIELAAKHDYETFAKEELGHRRRAQLPPITRMARIVVRHSQLDKAQGDAAQLAGALGESNEHLGTAVMLRGPFPAPVARIGGYHRQQIELIAGCSGYWRPSARPGCSSPTLIPPSMWTP
jgi:primosomal protein N' (replication factor Y) (superfamily II helicase)